MDIQYNNLLERNAQHAYELGESCFDWIFEKVSWHNATIKWHLDLFPQHCYQATIDDELIGFSLGFVDRRIGYISWIAIHVDFRRKGIGEKLLLLSINSLKEKSDYISSHVRDDNISNKLFEKVGFYDKNQKKIEMVIK
jgi:ribosomal protein S18 acetylase RimI-like enzyme